MMNEYVWKKHEYAKEQRHLPEHARRVMVIYSGGTLGMKYVPDRGYMPVPQYMERKMRSYPMFHDAEYPIPDKVFTEFSPHSPMALPVSYHKYRILYCINEYDPLMDSCNMNMDDWAKLAKDIERYYDQFDGFVILHGTDTMCYTASALSFMLENLSKPVVLTGAQVPLSELRSDARDNLLGALIMAGSGHFFIPEVTLYFNNKLLRGNRSTKMNSASFDAFDSPNLSPLATVGVHVTIHRHHVLKRNPEHSLKVHTTMCHDVGILKVFPGITATALGAFLKPPMKGVVLQTFGAGNLPAQPPLLEKLREACDRGVVVVNCTQCTSGVVTTNYPAARELCELGVVPGEDLTVEAALTKLSYLLGQPHLSVADIRESMAGSLCGELTSTTHNLISVDESDLLNVYTSSLLCEAAANGDNSTVNRLLQKGSRVDQANSDGRTALHLAASMGHLHTVKLLISKGASVHVQDVFHQTPLHNAIHFKREGVIRFLVKNNATIKADEFKLENAVKIFHLVAANDVDGLKAWKEAGVDLAHVNHFGFTLLEVAERNRALKVKTFLTSNK